MLVVERAAGGERLRVVANLSANESGYRAGDGDVRMIDLLGNARTDGDRVVLMPYQTALLAVRE